jgi:predicted RNase H-like nuclease (RuvC/YqgF family)
MTPDDSDDFDPTDETDPEVRELRAQIRELEARVAAHTAQLDQLMAGMMEQAAETETLHRRMDELEARFRRHRRWLWAQALVCATVGASLAQAVVLLLF